MGILRRVVRIVLGVTGFVLYTWYEAVRLTPAVKTAQGDAPTRPLIDGVR